MDFEIIIPTYKREEDLKKCLNSIYSQGLLPKRIILIDDDKLPKKFISEERAVCSKKGIELFYYIKNHSYEPRGSNESRNKGLELAKEEIVFIFDDDIILYNNFFEKIINVWENNDNSNLIGVGGIIVNNRKKGKLEKLYNRIFGLSGKYNWDMNSIGFQAWDDGISKREKGYYIHGGVCSYKKSLTKKLDGFTIFIGGRGGGVDPDFALRAKNKGYYFIIEPEAKVIHNKNNFKKESSFLSGFKDTYNRKIIFKNNCENNFKNYVLFYWANTGWILRKFLVGKFKSGFGMLKGLFKSV